MIPIWGWSCLYIKSGKYLVGIVWLGREFKLENENGNEDATHDVSKRSPFSSSLRVIFSLSGVESGR